MKLKIRTKLILIFIVLFTIPMLVSQIIFTKLAVSYAKTNTEQTNIQAMKNIGSSANLIFNYVYDMGLYVTSEQNISSFLNTTVNDSSFGSKRVDALASLAILPYTNQYIKGIYVSGMDDRFIKSGTGNFHISESEKRLLESLNGRPNWNYIPNKDSIGDIFFSRYLRNPNRLTRGMGYIKIKVNMAQLDEILKSALTKTSNFYIMNEDSQIIYRAVNDDTYTALAASLTPEILNASLDSTLYIPESDCYVTPFRFSSNSWYLFHISESTYTTEVRAYLRNARFIMTVICVAVCFLLSVLFSNIIVKPLKKLALSMKRIENEDFDVTVAVNSKDEIGAVSAQFNHMSARLRQLYHTVYLQDINLKTAQLDALMSQINPHFLYNTLDTIYWMSEFHHTEDVSRMISSLSKLFRLSLSGDQNDMVSLKDELEHVNCYLYIQKIRYEENLDCIVDIRVNPEKYMVLKLILQPITENAIVHGIDQSGEGTIRILIYEEDQNLIYDISNTGTADTDYIHSILHQSNKRSKSIGLTNIKERIQLRYSGEYGVTCHVEDGITHFKVTLPVIS